MSAACAPQGAFRWPSESLGFQWAVTVAVQQLPPGHMLVLKNGDPIPERFRETGAATVVQPAAAGSGLQHVAPEAPYYESWQEQWSWGEGWHSQRRWTSSWQRWQSSCSSS
eukprot:8099864-Lingulodinium_polyedra.AAC.1